MEQRGLLLVTQMRGTEEGLNQAVRYVLSFQGLSVEMLKGVSVSPVSAPRMSQFKLR